MSERTRYPLAIVAAVGRNGAIGRDGALPWHMPSDLAHFRALTIGKPMIMGRRTFESIGKALSGRESIVVSRDLGLALPRGVHRVGTPDAALDLAAERAAYMGANEVSLIGGATLFDAMIGIADRLHMTFVDLTPDADTFFPRIDDAIWFETGRRTPDRRPNDEAACVFVDYERVGARRSLL